MSDASQPSREDGADFVTGNARSTAGPGLEFDATGLAAAINQTGQAIVITDRRGDILYVNPAFEQMTGYSAREAIGRNPRILKSGKQNPAYYGELWETISSGGTWHGELVNQRKDGSSYIDEMTVTPICDTAGRIVRYIAVKQDVTERRAAEERRRFLAEIVDSSDDAIIGIALDGTISSWNRGAQTIYNYLPEEVIGRPVFLLSPPDIREAAVELFHTAKNGKTISQFETIRMKKDGTRIDVAIKIFPVRNPAGKIVGVASINRDIRAVRRINAALHLNAQRFRALFERSLDAVYIQDFDGKFLDMNPAALAITGYDASEIRGLDVTSLLAPGDIAIMRERLRELETIGAHRNAFEYRLKRKDGTYVDIETKGAMIPCEGPVRAFLGIARDVTERKRVSRALEESETRFRIMADGCPAMIWATDAEGGIRFANRATREYFATTYEGVQGNNWQDLLHPDDGPLYIAAFRKAVAERTSFQYEARGRQRNSTWRWVVSYAEPRWSPMAESQSREFLGHVGLTLDITDRKQAEERVRRSEEKFRQLAENIGQAFWMMNAEGDEMLYISPAYEEIWGRSTASLYRNPMDWAEALVPEDRDRALASFHLQLKGALTTSEYRIETPNGRVKWVRARAFPVRDKDGTIHRVAGIAEDITETKQAALTLRASKDAAEAASRAKSEFLANVSHEIRTPMNGVLAMAELLLETELAPDQRRYATIVHSSAESLLDVIHSILDFSKLEARRPELEIVDFQLESIFEDTLNLLSASAQQKSLKLAFAVDGNVPCRLRGDPARLRQILLDLGSNAIKFTPEGQVTLAAHLHAQNEGIATLQFTVEDTGIGIPADRLADIFSPFTQVDGSTTRQYGGTGLGLAISKHLVELMGGQIGVQSELGRGSKFWFTANFEETQRSDSG